MADMANMRDGLQAGGAGEIPDGGDRLIPLEKQAVDGEEKPEVMPLDAPGVRWSWRTFMKYVGPGWLMSLAYLDPGNLESDLGNGAYSAYSLIWVLFLCTLAGLILQVLAARLGTATGYSLAEVCRIRYGWWTSRVIWIMTEVAIIGSDVQEVVGTATALKTLFNLPLWAGCLITGCDTFTFLAIHYFGKRVLEAFITFLVFFMMICFFVNFYFAQPEFGDIVSGFVPICNKHSVSLMVGTIGAVIMPHNIYLHSGLATSRGVDRTSTEHIHQANKYVAADASIALFISFLINAALQTSFAFAFASTYCATLPDGPYACVPNDHGTCVGSCPACESDSGFVSGGVCAGVGLANAGDALQQAFGSGARYVFALGVLAAGQASTMTGTMAGQIVMEGFIQWKIPIWARTLLTRLLALGPAMIVALWTNAEADEKTATLVNNSLNILQSVQLPFALLPVLHFASDREVMGNRFALKKRYRALCWVLALIVVFTNFWLVGTTLKGEHWWVIVLAILAGILYLCFLSVMVRTELVSAWKIVSSCGRRQ